MLRPFQLGLGGRVGSGDQRTGWIGIDDWPPLAVYVAMMTLVPLASNLAAPPMLTVTFFGSLYSALPASHLDPSVLAASMALGWALNLTASPFGATALILDQLAQISQRLA